MERTSTWNLNWSLIDFLGSIMKLVELVDDWLSLKLYDYAVDVSHILNWFWVAILSLSCFCFLISAMALAYSRSFSYYALTMAAAAYAAANFFNLRTARAFFCSIFYYASSYRSPNFRIKSLLEDLYRCWSISTLGISISRPTKF